jgi:xanthine dehydrogenase accessory factor
MKEQKSILQEFKKIDFTNRKAALATVVKVHGSSYRSPGARMLITDDGRWVGSISGGCLEGDALRKARQVMQQNIAFTVTYDTREESNQNLGIGLGCNGVIDVLIEPIAGNFENSVIKILEQIVNYKQPVALATIFSSDRSSSTAQKLLISFKETILNTFDDVVLRKQVITDLRKLFKTQKSCTKTYQTSNQKCEVFLELIQPSISLILFGGGFDARPVSRLAKSLDWDVTVTDECVSHIAPIFFPQADKLTLCQRELIDRDFSITPYTACVLMSHNYEYDRDVLKKLLKTETPYIGILGPRKRFEKMVSEFQTLNIELTADDVHRIHSPIGLDIGAEAPDEIALSIIAEIQSKFTNRSGGFLKYKPGPIHHRDSESDQIFKQVYLADKQANSAKAQK